MKLGLKPLKDVVGDPDDGFHSNGLRLALFQVGIAERMWMNGAAALMTVGRTALVVRECCM